MALVFGFSLGGIIGALASTLSTLAGCALTFFLVRYTLRESVRKRLGKRLYRLEALLTRKPLLKALMIRLLPVGNNLLTNILAGATQIAAGSFLLGSFLGYLPQMLIFSLVGAGIGLSDHNRIMVSVALFIPATLIGIYLYRTRESLEISHLVTTPIEKRDLP